MIKLLYIGNALAKHGLSPTSADLVPDLFRKEGFKVDVASSKKRQLVRILDMLACILRNVWSVKYVLIDTYSTKNFWYAVLCSQLCRLLRLEYIPILHGGDLPKRMIQTPKMTKVILAHSFSIVTPSRYLMEAAKNLGYSAKLIPNTISISDYNFKKRLFFRPRILWVRSFAGLYNPQMALHVLDKLLKDYPEANLCMVGPDKDGTMEECKNLSSELGIEKHVQFTGKLSKGAWHKLSENYDIFINTTNKDNTPISVIEAMALGLPVVSTNPGGIPYLVNDSEDGLLVNTGDIAAMVRQIDFLLKNPNKAIAIARTARSKVEGFDWDHVKNKWNKLLI